jgi:DNA mismatch repair protein MutL
LRTYVIVEQGDRVLLIDKHAAHERMHFDRMKAAGWQPMAQTLLAPVLFTPTPQEGEVLLAHLPLLSRFGFACEDFGGGTLAVREIPDDLEPGQAEETLCEIAHTLLTGDKADPTAARDAVLHTMACKAAVKGGQKNSREELMVVAEAVVSGRVKYCPHGRPVAITMTQTELEKQFKRI